jgi:Right handed beta helix region
LVVALATFGLATSDAGACTLWVSDRGHDGNPGTGEAPFRNVQKLIDSLVPGQVGCLVPGSIFAERVQIRRPGIELRTAPGRRATIRGGIRVVPGADNVVIASLVIEGAPVGQPGTVLVEANGVRLARNDISGPFLSDQNVHCVLLNGAAGTIIEGNVIHRCTRVTMPRLYAAGIAVANATATTIRNNFIVRAPGDGIALAPNAHGSHVHHNLIDENRGGVYFGGSPGGASGDNRVVDNIISYSGAFNVHASYLPGGPVGENNVVSANCLWRARVANVGGAGAGFEAKGNLVASPRFRNHRAGYVLRPGPCYLNRPIPRAGGRHAVLPRFRIRYRLRALPRSVQVVGLTMINVVAGTAVDVRCVRGCRLSERLRAGGKGTASSLTLRGRWLRRGAMIEVRATKPWWVGHYARVVVTGLPRGVRIEHACLPPTGVRSPLPCERFG